ncbi:MAG: hypothetical protein Q8L15_10750 [Methylobacter sp.]|nr:hypothetical protein [Methylobacter sp.]
MTNWSDNIPEGGVLCRGYLGQLVLIKLREDDFMIDDIGNEHHIDHIKAVSPQEWWDFAPWNYDMDVCPIGNLFLLLDDGYVGEGYKSANYVDHIMASAQERVTNAIAWLPLQENK